MSFSNAFTSATGGRRRPGFSLFGRTLKSSTPPTSTPTLRRKNILSRGLLRILGTKQANSSDIKVRTFDGEDDMVVISIDDEHNHSDRPCSSNHSSPLCPSSASPSPVRKLRPSITKENYPQCCSDYNHSSASGVRISFKHNLTKLLAPPAGIPLALLNGSAPYIRSIQPTPRPSKRRYESFVAEDDRSFRSVNEGHELVDRRPKRAKNQRPAPTPEPGVVTRAAAARKMLETRRITRSMSSARDLARLTASSSQQSAYASPRRRRTGSTPKTPQFPRSPPPSTAKISSLPTGWSIVDESEFKFEFSLSGDVPGVESGANTLTDWAVVQPSTSSYPGASSAMAAFATVANLRSIVENSEGVESQFATKRQVKWGDVNWQHEYAGDLTPPTPSNSVIPLLDVSHVSPVPPLMTVDGLPGSGLATVPLPISAAESSHVIRAIRAIESATNSVPVIDEEVDITEMLGHASSHSSSSFVKVSQSDTLFAPPVLVPEARSHNLPQTQVITPYVVSPDHSRNLCIRTRPLSLPPVPSPIKRRVSPTLVPQLKTIMQQHVPSSLTASDYTGFGTVRASVFKNLRRDEMNDDRPWTTFPSSCEPSTVSSTAPNSPTSPTLASSSISSSLSSSIRLMGTRAVSIPNRVGQPPPLPLPTQPHEWRLSRTDEDKTHRRAASSPALLSSPAIVFQDRPRGAQSALSALLPAAVLWDEEPTMGDEPKLIQEPEVVAPVVNSQINEPVKQVGDQIAGGVVQVKTPSRVFVVGDGTSGDLISQAAYARPARSRLRFRGLPPHIDAASQDMPPPSRPRTPTPSSSAMPTQARGLTADLTPLIIGTVILPLSGLPQPSPRSTTASGLQPPPSPTSSGTRLRTATASPLARSAIVQRASKLSISSMPTP